jgi:hypothetical protein
LIISAVPVVFIGYLTYKTSEKEIKEETLEKLLVIAESKDVRTFCETAFSRYANVRS